MWELTSVTLGLQRGSVLGLFRSSVPWRRGVVWKNFTVLFVWTSCGPEARQSWWSCCFRSSGVNWSTSPASSAGALAVSACPVWRSESVGRVAPCVPAAPATSYRNCRALTAWIQCHIWIGQTAELLGSRAWLTLPSGLPRPPYLGELCDRGLGRNAPIALEGIPLPSVGAHSCIPKAALVSAIPNGSQFPLQLKSWSHWHL